MSAKKPAGPQFTIETVLPGWLEGLVLEAEKELSIPLEKRLAFLPLMSRHEAVNAILALADRDRKIRYLRPRLKTMLGASIEKPTSGNT